MNIHDCMDRTIYVHVQFIYTEILIVQLLKGRGKIDFAISLVRPFIL